MMTNEQPREDLRTRPMTVTGTVLFERHVMANDFEEAEQIFLEAIEDDHGSYVASQVDRNSIEVQG